MPSLRFIAICTLLSSVAVAAPTSLWYLNNLENRAPSPQGPSTPAQTPPEESTFPYQVLGIVGAYLLSVAIVLLLIFFVARPLRRKAQTSNTSLNIEMVRTPARADEVELLGTTPVSPAAKEGFRAWISPRPTHKSNPSQTTVSTFDERVVEMDKARNMSEMERLYAAVMAHDDLKPKPHQSPKRPAYQKPQELQYLRLEDPPAEEIGMAVSSPDDEYPRPMATSPPLSIQTKASPMSFFSTARTRVNSANSADSMKSRPSRISVWGRAISKPMGSPDSQDSAIYSEPRLSPRIYSPGPAPSTPGQQFAATQAQDIDRKGYMRAAPPAPLALRSNTAPTGSQSLPFRQYADSTKSAPPTKTTFLERRESYLNPGARTGIPGTPHSPYIPTPMTPITPGRLMTRSDLKMKRKQEGLKVLNEDDMVPTEAEMW